MIVVGLLVAIGARNPGLRTVVAGMVVLGAGAVTTIVGMVLVYRRFGSSRPSDDLLRRALARDVAGLDGRSAGGSAVSWASPSSRTGQAPATGDQEKRPNSR